LIGCTKACILVVILQKKTIDKEAAMSILSKRIDEWGNRSKNDAYEYEKHFIEVMQGLTKDLFQLSVGEVSVDRNKKKSKRN